MQQECYQLLCDVWCSLVRWHFSEESLETVSLANSLLKNGTLFSSLVKEESRKSTGQLLSSPLAWEHLSQIFSILGALSLGVKRPGSEADHSPPSSAEVKECVELYLHLPVRLRGMVLG